MSTPWRPLPQAAEFRSVLPAFARLPQSPRFSFGTWPADVAIEYYQHLHFWSVGVYVAEGLLVCDGFLLDEKYVVLMGGDVKLHQVQIDEIDSAWVLAVSTERPQAVRGVVASIIPPGPAYRIYGHWMIDILPRLAVLEAAGFSLDTLYYPVPEDLPDFGRELLRLFGVPDARIIPYAAGAVLQAEKLLVPTLLTHGVQCSPLLSTFVDTFKQRLSRAGHDLLARDAPARVFLGRAGGDRKLVNREEINAMAQAAGFVVVRPETMSLPEQFALFTSAREIAGEYGSAFHTALFSPPGTVVCGLRGNKAHPGFIQAGIGHVLGQPTGWVFGNSENANLPDDYTIPKDVFQDCLRLAFGSDSHVAASVHSQSPPNRTESSISSQIAEGKFNSGLSIPELERVTGMPSASFITSFESLGTNCEFGFLQRLCGAEPISLFRFAGLTFETLLRCLKSRFDGIGQFENLEIILADGPVKEYTVRDKLLRITHHTWRYEDQIDEDLLLKQQATRLKMMRRKLIEDLEEGEKIFVWKSHLQQAEADVVELHKALDAYAQNTLLWVVEAEQHRPAGTLEEVVPRLLKGYVDRFAPTQNVPDVSPAHWLEVCAKAYSHARGNIVFERQVIPEEVSRGPSEADEAAMISPQPLQILAHIQNRGDTESGADGWAGSSGSGLAVEGFAILETMDFPADALEYHAILASSSRSAGASLGEYVGTRSLNKPILGFSVAVPELYSHLLDVTYAGRFLDGTTVGPMAAGSVCMASSGSPLEALRIMCGFKLPGT